jgi:hypothetical protein
MRPGPQAAATAATANLAKTAAAVDAIGEIAAAIVMDSARLAARKESAIGGTARVEIAPHARIVTVRKAAMANAVRIAHRALKAKHLATIRGRAANRRTLRVRRSRRLSATRARLPRQQPQATAWSRVHLAPMARSAHVVAAAAAVAVAARAVKVDSQQPVKAATSRELQRISACSTVRVPPTMVRSDSNPVGNPTRNHATRRRWQHHRHLPRRLKTARA